MESHDLKFNFLALGLSSSTLNPKQLHVGVSIRTGLQGRHGNGGRVGVVLQDSIKLHIILCCTVVYHSDAL